MYDPKKGKYTEEENNHIINTINKGLSMGKRERDLLKEIAMDLNRGYAGIMSHVRKLRLENPNRFISSDNSADDQAFRLNSWEENEENLVIDTVNSFLDEGKSLSAAIAELESKLSRTQGAIYQRIYTLRRKNPEKFSFIPQQRPRRRRKLQEWQMNRPIIRNLEDTYHYHTYDDNNFPETSLNQHMKISNPAHSSWSSAGDSVNAEESLILKTFEERYGRPNSETRDQLLLLMRQYGCTRVSIALLTLADDKNFPNVVADFLSKRLQHQKFL